MYCTTLTFTRAAMATRTKAFCWLTLFVFAECVLSSGLECPGNCSCTEDLLVHCDGHDSTSRDRLPVGLPTNTSYLKITNYNLPVLDLSELDNFTQLEGIVLSSNKIRHVKGTLQVFKHITQVDLGHNELTVISKKFFGNITKLTSVSLTGNPFNCDCGGIGLDSDTCDCSDGLFNCICNMNWLQKQVKQNPNIWGGVYCHNSSKDTDIKDMPDITDYWCRHKWGYLMLIIAVSTMIMQTVTCIVLFWRCKGRNSSETIRQGYVQINGSDTIGNVRQANYEHGDTEPKLPQSLSTPQATESLYGKPSMHRKAAAVPDVPTSGASASHSLPSQQLSQRVVNKLVTEQDLNRLAGKVLNVWESLAIHLGLDSNNVARIRRDYILDSQQQSFNMLLLWKSKNGSNATIGQLISKLETSESAIDVDKYSFLMEEP